MDSCYNYFFVEEEVADIDNEYLMEELTSSREYQAMCKILDNELNKVVKKCTGCGEVLPATLDYFNRDIYNYKTDGLNKKCKKCVREINKPHAIRSREKNRAKNKTIVSWNKNIKKRCPLGSSGLGCGEILPATPEYFYRGVGEFGLSGYCKNCDNRYRQKRLEENPVLKLGVAVSRGIYYSLGKGKGGHHWEDLVGYTLEELVEHLSSLFTEGMTIENHGKTEDSWQIDHIIPQSRFNFTSYDDPEFKECWALENLQPLWARDNFRKHAKTMEEYLAYLEEIDNILLED